MAIVRSAHVHPDRPGEQLTDTVAAPQLGSRRRQVLQWLAASGPASSAQVAAGTGLHVNTARFHLDALVEDGLARRRADEAGVRGRPRILYTAAPVPAAVRSYQLLGQMLAGLGAVLDPDGSGARTAGAEWGRRLVESKDGTGQGPESELDALLTRVGFEHEWSAENDEDVRLQIGHCPFVEVARGHPDVVCAMHAGLIEGALSGLGAPLALQGLQPFADEQQGMPVCVAHLARTPRPR